MVRKTPMAENARSNLTPCTTDTFRVGIFLTDSFFEGYFPRRTVFPTDSFLTDSFRWTVSRSCPLDQFANWVYDQTSPADQWHLTQENILS